MEINKNTILKVIVLALGKALLEGLTEAKQQRDYERPSRHSDQAPERQAQATSASFWKGVGQGDQAMNDEHSNSGKFGEGMFFGTLLGAAVGAGLALWYAPQSGRKTQQMLHRKATHLQKTVNKKANALYEEAEEIADNARERVSERMSDLHQQGRQFVDEKVSQVSDAAQAVRERASR